MARPRNLPSQENNLADVADINEDLRDTANQVYGTIDALDKKIAGHKIKLRSLSPNRLFLSNLRFESRGELEVTESDFKKPEVQRAIQLMLVELVDE